MSWLKINEGIKTMLSMVKSKKCPNCGMPLADEMSCDYCEWKANAK